MTEVLSRLNLLFEQLLARGLQPVNHDLGDALHQFVAKLAVLFRRHQQIRAVQHDGRCRLQGPRLKVPRERWEQPRPAQHVTSDKRLDEDAAIRRLVRFDGDASALDEVKLIRRLPSRKRI